MLSIQQLPEVYNRSVELAVIGSGPGGYEAALRAAKAGMKVCLIEKADLGGVCVNWGCIPTKTLLRSAELFDSVKRAPVYGIKEALRVQTYLNLFGYKLDAAIVNKILPASSTDSYLQSLIDIQSKYLKVIENCFYPVPIFRVKQSTAEIINTERLYTLSQEMFGEKNPADILYTNDKTQRLEKVNGKYVLSLYLPNVEVKKLNVNIKGDELLVDINNFRKSIILPNVLVGRKTEGADFDEGNLNITFTN